MSRGPLHRFVRVLLDSNRSGALLRDPDAALRDRAVGALTLLLLPLAVVAIASLVAEYGFDLDARGERLARYGVQVVLVGYASILAAKLLIVRRRLAYLKSRWLDYSVWLLVVGHLVFPGILAAIPNPFRGILGPGEFTRFYVVAAQIYVVLALVPPAIRYGRELVSRNVEPAFVIVTSFVAMIAAGTGLLMLPKAVADEPLGFLDALFTATSAVCVTGLTVVDTQTAFTPLGHGILLFLIQIGGLGIMTLTTFFFFLLGGGRLRELATVQSLLQEESLGRLRRMVAQIAILTFVLEALGALILYLVVPRAQIPGDTHPVFFALFHAVSAFCNAGFSLTPPDLGGGALARNGGLLGTISVLVILGGLGYPVLTNLGARLVPRGDRTRTRRLSVHTRLVLVTSAILIVLGTAGLYALEAGRALAPLSIGERLGASLFHSISARTAGFSAIDLGELRDPTWFFVMFLMWIGASPASTGGGIKTTTAALALLNIHSIVSGRRKVEVFQRTVSESSIVRAFSTVLLSVLYLATAFFVLLLTESLPYPRLLFELVSAFGTVGYSTGVTAELSPAGKAVITVSMFVGRVSLLSVLLALMPRAPHTRYDYTEENVLVT